MTYFCGIPHRSRLGSVVRNHCSSDADSCGVAVGRGAWRGNCIGSIGNIGGLKEALGSLRTPEVVEGVPENIKKKLGDVKFTWNGNPIISYV